MAQQQLEKGFIAQQLKYAQRQRRIVKRTSSTSRRHRKNAKIQKLLIRSIASGVCISSRRVQGDDLELDVSTGDLDQCMTNCLIDDSSSHSPSANSDTRCPLDVETTASVEPGASTSPLGSCHTPIPKIRIRLDQDPQDLSPIFRIIDASSEVEMVDSISDNIEVICARKGCNNLSVISENWDDEYCCSRCVVLHCQDMFTSFMISRQNQC